MRLINRQFVTCQKCKAVHIAVTRDFAVKSVETVLERYKTLSSPVSVLPSVSDYEKCVGCGASNLQMRQYKEGDGEVSGAMVIIDKLVVV